MFGDPEHRRSPPRTPRRTGPVLGAILVALTASPTCAPLRPAHLPTVDTLTVHRDADGTCRFNEDRRYVIGFHRVLADTGIEQRLARRLAGSALAGEVLVQWFGDARPDRIELILGRDLPTALAAAIVEVTGDLAPLPIAVSTIDSDDAVCQRAQAYVGALLPTETPDWSPDQLDNLVRHQDDPDAFWTRVPVVRR